MISGGLVEQLWHYQNDSDGKRLGPVPYDELKQLIADNRVTRSTLVWNPAMSEWAVASKTELLGLFGEQPPPLPSSSLPSWPIYALAFAPVWSGLLVAFLCDVSAASYHITPVAMYASLYWFLAYVAIYSVLGATDAMYLQKAGVDMRWALLLIVLFIPGYVIARGARLRKTYQIGHMQAYAPFYILAVMTVASLFVAPFYFGLDAMAVG